jgi:phage replication initiation protein
MGAENTSAPVVPPENQILIDWLSWTVKTQDPAKAIEISGLEALPFIETKGGVMGYKRTMRCGNISVYFDGNENMGVHIVMSGKGCRQYETYKNKDHCWYQLLHTLNAAEAKITRVDVAIDNVDGALDLDKLDASIRSKRIRSKFKGGHRIEGFSFNDENEEKGRTIYIGSPTSRLKLRFYDKAAQFHIDEVHWVRCELQLMAERAQEFVRHLLKGHEIGSLAVSVLNNYFQVINLDDTNRSRCSLQSWWSAWLTTTDKIRLATMKAIRVVPEVMEYLRRQYSPTIAMCKKFLGVTAFHEFIRDLVTDGLDRMTVKHDMIIACSNLETELPF